MAGWDVGRIGRPFRHQDGQRFDLARRERWWAGALDFVLEPELAINFSPDDTGVGGGVRAARW